MIEDLLWELMGTALVALTLNKCEDLIVMLNSADKHSLMANYGGLFETERTLTGGEYVSFLGIQVKEVKGKAAPIIVKRIC